MRNLFFVAVLTGVLVLAGGCVNIEELLEDGTNVDIHVNDIYIEKVDTDLDVSVNGGSDRNADDIVATIVEDVFRLTNELRGENGIDLLEYNGSLEQVAMVRGEEISVLYEHDRPNGNGLKELTDIAEYSYVACGENIHKIPVTEENPGLKLFTDWKNSPNHYTNMINENYQDIGVGIYFEGDYICGVQIFGKEQKMEVLEPWEIADIQDLIVADNNLNRKANNMGELEINDTLVEIASQRAEELSVFYSNTREDGSSSGVLLQNSGLSYSWGGEAILKITGVSDSYASEITDMWNDNSGYCQYMLDSTATHTGIGIYADDTWLYIVQFFAELH